MTSSLLANRRLYLWLIALIVILQGVPLLLLRTHGQLLRSATPVSAGSASLERLVDERLQPAALRDAFTRYPQVALLFGVLIAGAAVLLVTGLLMNLRWLWRRRASDAAAEPPAATPRMAGHFWSLADVWRLLILSLFISSLAPWLASLLLLRRHRPDPMTELLFITAAAELMILWMVAEYARAKGQRLLQVTGLAGRSMWKVVGLGLRRYTALLPPLIATLLVGSWIARAVGYTPPPHPLSTLFLQEERAGILGFAVVFACVGGPFLEEIIFRGVVFGALRSRFSVGQAMVVSAVLFAALHRNWIALAPITLLGCLLAQLYEETGSLWASIIVHTLHNSVMIGLVWLMRLLVRLPAA